MSYFGFLLRFLVIPILLLAAVALWDRQRGRALPPSLSALSPWPFIGLLALVAVIYTTPWDNYLVATGVWWYDPALVTGITLGWVPLEEYCFFVLQSILVGLWWVALARRLPEPPPFQPSTRLRGASVAAVALLWVGSVILLLSGWKPGTYLGLELVWALPPIALQLAVGADILWHYRRLVGLTILPAVLYLAATDRLAIGSGTWTIDPQQSLAWFIAGLPVEELIFFLLTTVLLGFGLTLCLAQESQERARGAWTLLAARGRRAPAPQGTGSEMRE